MCGLPLLPADKFLPPRPATGRRCVPVRDMIRKRQHAQCMECLHRRGIRLRRGRPSVLPRPPAHHYSHPHPAMRGRGRSMLDVVCALQRVRHVECPHHPGVTWTHGGRLRVWRRPPAHKCPPPYPAMGGHSMPVWDMCRELQHVHAQECLWREGTQCAGARSLSELPIPPPYQGCPPHVPPGGACLPADDMICVLQHVTRCRQYPSGISGLTGGGIRVLRPYPCHQCRPYPVPRITGCNVAGGLQCLTCVLQETRQNTHPRSNVAVRWPSELPTPATQMLLEWPTRATGMWGSRHCVLQSSPI